jgi:hypothetical protein
MPRRRRCATEAALSTRPPAAHPAGVRILIQRGQCPPIHKLISDHLKRPSVGKAGDRDRARVADG